MARVFQFLPCLLPIACASPDSEGSGGDDSPEGSSGSGHSAEEDASQSGDATEDTAGDQSDGDAEGETKWDLAPWTDVSGGGCGGGGVDDGAFSFIWVANSAQGTISKINTETLLEEGRYIVRPDSAGNPSRTSVNLNGDVAVANRYGGISKVYARNESCTDTNGTPGIQSSTGKNDVLAWGQEECLAWYTAMNYTSQRPLAWDQGILDEGTCTYSDTKVWTASSTGASVTVSRLSGDDGVVEEFIAVPEVSVGGYGPYGGAVDGDGAFWWMHRDGGVGSPLVRHDPADLSYEIWPIPTVNPYGFTVDTEGRPWIAGFQGGIARFDPQSETFQVNAMVTGVGMMADAENRMWIAHFPWDSEGVSALDTETLELVDFIDVPSSLGKGVSIDFNGYVWLVDMTSSAFRIDPETHEFLEYDGLDGPYTYSDMTGFGLASVTNPQD